MNSSSQENQRVTDELRYLLDVLASRAEPLLHKVSSGGASGHNPATCNWCPVCASMALLRGQRPELAVRAAEHAAGLLAVFRAAMQDQHEQHAHAEQEPAGFAEPGRPGAADPRTAAPPPPRRNRVQKIELRRPGSNGSGSSNGSGTGNGPGTPH